jgi:hypothetical protein
MKNGMDRGIRGAFEEKKFQLGRGFWRRWIAWTRWLRIGSIGRRFRWI